MGHLVLLESLDLQVQREEQGSKVQMVTRELQVPQDWLDTQGKQVPWDSVVDQDSQETLEVQEQQVDQVILVQLVSLDYRAQLVTRVQLELLESLVSQVVQVLRVTVVPPD